MHRSTTSSARLLFAAALVAAAAGCSSHHHTTAPVVTGPPAGTMTAAVNGQAWAATDTAGHPLASAFPDTLSGFAFIVVGGVHLATDTTGSVIALALPQPVAVGHIGLGPFAAGEYVVVTTDTTFFGTDGSHTGSVQVTRYDRGTAISGTFAFTAVNSGGATVSITNGVFDVGFHALPVRPAWMRQAHAALARRLAAGRS